MKILIVAINAKYIHSNLAAYSLKAYALKHLREEFPDSAVKLEIAEYTINQYTEQILADLYRYQPDVIAFSCYIWNIAIVEQLLPELKKVLPNVDLWLGGPEVSYHAGDILKKLPVRGIMMGEGERIFLEVLRCYIRTEHEHRESKQNIHERINTQLQTVMGLACPEFETQMPPYMDMNELVFPYTSDYLCMGDLENRIIYYESSRGCPFSCTYCLSSIEKTVRLKEVPLVKKELDILIQMKVRQVKFVDRTFNCNHHHAMEIWQYIKEHDNGVTNFHFEIEADLLSQEELDLLSSMRPGLFQLEIGVQSVHERTIQEINRKADYQRIAKAVRCIQQHHNIHLHLDLIAGLPTEDYQGFVQSFCEVYALHPEQLQLGFLKVLKGSPMEERAGSYNIQYLSGAPYEVLSTKWITYEEILKLKAVEQMLELYYNSNQFVYTIGLLEQVFQDGYVLYQSLADFYAESGYTVVQPSRLKRYEILLAFAEKYDPKRTHLYRESLTLDLYLRENLKNRPGFATDRLPYQEQIQTIYRDEELLREYLPEYQAYDTKQISKMTHMEVFHYFRQIEGIRIPDTDTDPCYMIFDYQMRDPLTQNARVIWIHRERIKG